MNAVEFQGVSKSYAIYESPGDRLKELLTFNRLRCHKDFWALHDLSLEVRRGETILDKVAIGSYYFDHVAGWEGRQPYAVRAVDGDGNASGWTVAEPAADEPGGREEREGTHEDNGRALHQVISFGTCRPSLPCA